MPFELYIIPKITYITYMGVGNQRWRDILDFSAYFCAPTESNEMDHNERTLWIGPVICMKIHLYSHMMHS